MRRWRMRHRHNHENCIHPTPLSHQFFSTNHQCSFGLGHRRMGEKPQHSHPAAIQHPQLRMMETGIIDNDHLPDSNCGKRHSSNHISNKSRLHDPEKVMGAKMFLAWVLRSTCRSVRLPDLRAWNRCQSCGNGILVAIIVPASST